MIEVDHIEVGDHSIAYRQSGEGPPLVMLHGFLCDSRCWESQLIDLSDRFRVVAWDAPGAGASSDPPDPFSTGDWAHCLAEFLDSLGIDKSFIVGLSWGGILAQEFYRLYPGRVLGLVLADTYAGWKGSLPEPIWRERLASCLLDASGPAAELVRKFLPGLFTDAAPQELRDELSIIVSQFHPIGFRLMSVSSAAIDTRDLLPTISVPTLILWGDDDRRSPMSVAQQLYEAVPGSELVIIPDAGHMSNIEQPRAFNAHVRHFCVSNVSA